MYDGFGQLETLLTQLIMLIAGCEASTRWQSENVIKRVKGTKELVIIDGANRFDTTDYNMLTMQK